MKISGIIKILKLVPNLNKILIVDKKSTNKSSMDDCILCYVIASFLSERNKKDAGCFPPHVIKKRATFSSYSKTNMTNVEILPYISHKN